MSGIIEKVKDALSSDKKRDNTITTDPVTHHGTSGTGVNSTTGTHTTHGNHGTTTSTNYGPPDSNLANKADPRLDSDMDNRGALWGTHGTTQGATYGTTPGSHGTGPHGTHGTYGSTNIGPHDSNLKNKADPRIDSDMDHRGAAGGFGTTGATATHGTHATTYGTHGTHATTGTGYGSTSAGPHDSNVANKTDPRVDSDLDGRGAVHHGTSGHLGGAHVTPGSGRAPNTAGPHNSDKMNKMDPRVDSDMDGSKTVGGNKTHTRGGSGGSGKGIKDPSDAAHVPPSVMQEHMGAPIVKHDSHPHDHTRRHGSKTADTLRDYGGGALDD